MATNKGRRVHHDLWKGPKKGDLPSVPGHFGLASEAPWVEGKMGTCKWSVWDADFPNNHHQQFKYIIIFIQGLLYTYICILYIYTYIHIHTANHIYIFIVKHNHVYSVIHDRDPFLTDATKLKARISKVGNVQNIELPKFTVGHLSHMPAL